MADPTAIPTCSDCEAQVPDPAERWPSASTGIVCQVCWEAQCSRQWWAMVQLLPEVATNADRQRRYRERKAGRLAGGRRVPCVCCPRRHTGIYGAHCYRCWLRQTVEGRAVAAQRVRDSRARAKRDKLSTGPTLQP